MAAPNQPGRNDEPINSDWQADVRFEAQRGADMRPDFIWKGAPKAMMGFR
jgi:hypothetical protein